VLGLPGIMMFRAQCDDPGPLTIIGPPGLERFVRHTLEDLRYHLNYRLEFVEWNAETDADAWSWHGHQLRWDRLEHSTFCLGYRLEEAARPGRFHPDKAAALGVPPGPLFGRLQAGEPVQAPDGSTVQPAQVLGATRRGRVVAYATDTVPCRGLSTLLAGADLAFVEGMFARVHEAEADAKRHMTAAQAARAAAAARVARLVLVHISPRYTLQEESILETEAREHFPGAEVGRGLQAFEVPLPD
jgi:ribonuclease Z